MTSLLQEVVDGSGMELHGREYLILVLKVFRVLREQQVPKEHQDLQVLKVRLLHRVLKVLQVLQVHKVQQDLQDLLVLKVQQEELELKVQQDLQVLKVHKVMRVTLVVLHFIILLKLTPRMQIQVQEI
jgi:hypothetical protein